MHSSRQILTELSHNLEFADLLTVSAKAWSNVRQTCYCGFMFCNSQTDPAYLILS